MPRNPPLWQCESCGFEAQVPWRKTKPNRYGITALPPECPTCSPARPLTLVPETGHEEPEGA